MKTSGLLTNMQSRFLSLDLDGVLQQPTPVTIRLKVSFYLCSSRSKVERQRLRSLEGCLFSSKSLSGAGDQDEGVSGGNGREMCFLTPISGLPYIWLLTPSLVRILSLFSPASMVMTVKERLLIKRAYSILHNTRVCARVSKKEKAHIAPQNQQMTTDQW